MSEATMSITDGSFDTDVIKSETPVMVDFWAPWCGPCRTIGPILEELAPTVEGKFKIVKLNVDENTASASKFGVMSIPTMIIFQNGQEVDRIVGAISKDKLQEHIQKAIEG